MVQLMFCSVLMGVSLNGTVQDVTYEGEDEGRSIVANWTERVRIMQLIRNDKRSMWILGETEKQVEIGFIVSLGPRENFGSILVSASLETDEEEEMNCSLITAVTMDTDLTVIGDVKGSMWFVQSPEPSTWRNRKPAHSDRISVLKLTDSTIISASYDRTVKLWDRNTKKQVGMFVCGAPVLLLEVNPKKPTELVCGDRQGKLYFLSWNKNNT